MIFECCLCGNDLENPGALAFSPPVNGGVDKYHICTSCWKVRVRPVLEFRKLSAELLSHVPTEEEIQTAQRNLDEILGVRGERYYVP